MLETNTESLTKTPKSNRHFVAFTGDSMTPFLRPHRNVFVEFWSTPNEKHPQLGNIYFLRSAGEFVVHRCVRAGTQPLFKGDHSMQFDQEPVVMGEVLAVDGASPWLHRQAPSGIAYAFLSRGFQSKYPRAIRWIARGAMILFHKQTQLKNLFIRRLRQVFQLLTDQQLRSHEGLIELARNRYTSLSEVSFYQQIAHEGFEEEERIAVASALASVDEKNRALVLGCGAGRETFALINQFSSVLGLDWSSPMIEAAETHPLRTSAATFRRGSLEVLSPEERFDFVFVARGVLNHLPGQKNRAELLRRLEKHLSCGGRILVQVQAGQASLLQRDFWSAQLLKLINPDWEAGDTLRSFLGIHSQDWELFGYHLYPSNADFLREARAAGLQAQEVSQGFFVLSKGLDPSN